jgi:DNA-binding winged helix-turn-helix (wHTH) protein
MRVRFDEFVLDGGTRQLLRGQHVRHLSPKAFDLLELLLSQRPNVVTKQRIRARLWTGTYVTDSTLATLVGEVRSALGEDAKKPRLLRTIHGVGYAFCGTVLDAGGRSKAPGAAVAFRLRLSDREVALRSGENVLGRVEDGVVWIESVTVSRRHARILVDEHGATIEDLGSKNGTFVRGERISGPTLLAHGDVIRLGRVSMELRRVRTDVSTLSAID